MVFEEYHDLLIQSLVEDHLVCEGMYGECGIKPARETPCRTAYAKAEANISPVLCEQCAKEYNEYWDDMWSNVPRG